MVVEGTIALSTLIITLLVIIININACKKGRKWDILEWLIAVLVGWFGVVYILIYYYEELIGRCQSKKEKTNKSSKEEKTKTYI